MSQRIEKLSEKYSKEVADFFGIKQVDFNLIILNSRHELNEVKGFKTEDWLIGFAKNGTVYILNKDKWETESIHPKTEFEKALKHEIAHIYYEKFKGNTVPAWLNEGTAIYIAKQKKIWPELQQKQVNIAKIESVHHGGNAAPIGFFMVERIIENFGKQKLLNLIKIMDRQERYKELKRMFDWLK